jgi:hypothetical protein
LRNTTGLRARIRHESACAISRIKYANSRDAGAAMLVQEAIDSPPQSGLITSALRSVLVATVTAAT